MVDNLEVDWMPDDASSTCLICQAEFTLRNRRHHCRRCGRLVCKSCSNNFINLSDQPMDEKQEHRVCEDCWASIQRKKEVAPVINYQRAKELALLSASSRVSDQLLRVYLLDGSFKTIVYEAETTASEVASKVCMGGTALVALFQVEQDLRNPDEFRMIDSHETITNVFQRWETNGLTTGKIAVPMYSAAPNDTPLETSKTVAAQRSNSFCEPREPAASGAERITQLEGELDELKRKYDTLYAAHKKFLKAEEENASGRPTLLRGQRQPSFISHRGGSFSVGLQSTRGTTPDSGGDSFFKPLQPEFSFTSVESCGDRDSSFGNGEMVEPDDVSIISTDEYPAQTPIINTDQKILRSGFLEKKGMATLVWHRRYVVLTADGVLRWYSTHNTQSTAQLQGFLALRNIVRVNRGSSSKVFIIVSHNSKISFRAPTSVESAEWITILQSICIGAPVPDFLPDLYRVKTSESDQDHSDLLDTHMAPTALTGITIPKLKFFFNKVHSVDSFFSSFDDSLKLTLSSGVESPEDLLNAYEIVDAMQKMYGRVLSYGEDWTSTMRDWLLRSLRATMVLPIDRPELLMTVIQCMGRENMLHSPETLRVVDQVIELSFDRNANVDVWEMNSLEGILETVKCLVNTLHMVVDELIPLVPDHFNVIAMFQQKAEARIRSHVIGYYMTNKDTIENKDVLILLSWAEDHKTVMQRFGVNQFSDEFKALEVDLVKRYRTQVQALQRQWMERIHEADIIATVQQLDVSIITNWPEDLAGCLRQQFDIAASQLPGEVGGRVCSGCLQLLQEFRKLQQNWLNATSSTLSIERICAYSNNHNRFANVLTDIQTEICDQVDKDVYETLNDAFNDAIAWFTEESTMAVAHVTRQATADLRSGMADHFFNEQWSSGGRGPIDKLRGIVQSYTKDVKAWFAQFGQYHNFVSNIIRDIIALFLELLVTSSLDVDAATLERLEEDLDILVSLFRLYEDVMPLDKLEKELRPLKNFVTLFRKDHRNIEQFVRDELTLDFGSATLKVWQQAMTMKNESKTIQEAMYDAIVRSWAPPAAPARIIPDVLDKLKAPKGRKFRI